MIALSLELANFHKLLILLHRDGEIGTVRFNAACRVLTGATDELDKGAVTKAAALLNRARFAAGLPMVKA